MRAGRKKDVMNIKFIHKCMGLMTFISVFLGVYAMKCGPVREMDNYRADIVDRTKNYYDEEMAAELAAIMIRPEGGEKMQGDLVYEREIVFNYPTNEWLVIFTPKDSSKGKVIMGVRRDNGTMNRY